MIIQEHQKHSGNEPQTQQQLKRNANQATRYFEHENYHQHQMAQQNQGKETPKQPPNYKKAVTNSSGEIIQPPISVIINSNLNSPQKDHN